MSGMLLVTPGMHPVRGIAKASCQPRPLHVFQKKYRDFKASRAKTLQGGGGCCVHFSGEHLTLARSPTTLVRPSQRQDETIARVLSCSDFRDSLLNSHTCRPKLPLRAPPLAPRADGHVMLHALPVLVRKPCSASSKTAGGSQDRVTDVLTSLHSNMVRKSLRTCRSWCSPRQ